MANLPNLRNCSTNCVRQSVCAILGVQTKNCEKPCSHQSIRTFSRTCQLAKSRNFYDDLKIPKTATQAEIKSAYYNLSMLYHPDKNKGDEAAQSFRHINAAYEVLGNFRTRRMYDKGIGSFGRTTQSNEAETVVEEEVVEDDAQTKFYKQHMVKSQPPEMANRTTARDFDQWAVDRITQTFQQKKRVKELIREREQDMHDAEARDQFRLVFCICLLAIILLASYWQKLHIHSHNAELRKIKENKS